MTLDDDKQEIVLTQALQETERLDLLVEKILLANRIESSAYFIQKDNFNLSALSHKIINNLKSTLLKNHLVNVMVQSDINMLGDHMAFTSILINLLDNAAKYSPNNSRIDLVLSKENETITLAVKDEGVGISLQEGKEVFNKFYRSGNEETRNTKGTGLGLYIVKSLIVLHQGQIKISPNKPKGTIFTVQFKALNNA